MNRRFIPSALLIAFLLLVTAQACSPGFYPDVFVRKMRPDTPSDFAAGKLGVLLPTYPRADLTVAYRYLSGGSLTAQEQAAYRSFDGLWRNAQSHEEEEDSARWQKEEAAQKLDVQPLEDWRAAREHYGPSLPAIEQNRELRVKGPNGSEYGADYQNCNIDAFRNALQTMHAREKSWGPRSVDLADWLKGQDAVFSNCGGSSPVIPGPVPAGASPLLRADRAYQTAAAEFYSASFESARKHFQAVAQDSDSPWQGIAGYLAARCLVRQAFLANGVNGQGNQAGFDPALLRQAADLLAVLLKTRPSGVSRRAIQNELDLVRLRIEPEARAHEIASALAGPQPDPAFDQHFKDLNWYLNAKLDEQPVREDYGNLDEPTKDQEFSNAYGEFAALRSSSALIDWLITFQSPAKEAAAHALAEWRTSHQLPWLLAAIAKANDKDAAPALVAAAAEIQPDSPAWESITYHRLRLLILLGRAAEARALLDQFLPQIKATGRDSSLNAYLGLRMSASPSLEEFLSYAPRKMLAAESESANSRRECLYIVKNTKRLYDCSQDPSLLHFSDDAAGVLNAQTPLTTLADMAASPQLPQHLRRSVALMGWTRSVLLKDDAAAARFFPLLPAKLQQQAGAPTGFHALLTLVRNPGLRPYLESGVQRNDSYDFVESFADNWWCGGLDADGDREDVTPVAGQPLAFLPLDQQATVQREIAALREQGPAEVTLGTQVLDFVQAHPADPDAPESLFLVLRMIRYGCFHGGSGTLDADSPQTKIDRIRKSAARLLRQRYASSPWTKKAAPFAG